MMGALSVSPIHSDRTLGSRALGSRTWFAHSDRALGTGPLRIAHWHCSDLPTSVLRAGSVAPLLLVCVPPLCAAHVRHAMHVSRCAHLL